jgi:K+-sensing histidine kinase KdpD
MRRSARLVRRRGGSCVVVSVQSDPGVAEGMERLRDLAAQLGCAFTILGGRDIATAIVQVALDVGGEHVVVGEMTARRAPVAAASDDRRPEH